MKAWLSKEQALLNELRAIGLMLDQSMLGMDLERWNFMPVRLAKSRSEAHVASPPAVFRSGSEADQRALGMLTSTTERIEESGIRMAASSGLMWPVRQIATALRL